MMRTMRSMAKWIMSVVAVAFVGWMVFDVGMDLGGQSVGANPEVIDVNGTSVTLQEYNQRVRGAQEEQRLSGGQAIVTLEDQRALEDAVFERIVQEAILQEEYARRGITVTDEEVRQALLNVPPPEIRQAEVFQTEGQFDLQKYQNYLRSGADPAFVLAIETQYRQEIPRLKLFERLTQDVYVSNHALWRMYRDEHETVIADVLVLLPQAVVSNDEVTVTDQELHRFYGEHGTEFGRPARAYMSFVAISRQPNAADSAAALERARRVRQEVVGGGDFAEIARRESADSASAVEGGDLGEAPKGQFMEPFEDAALALPPGQISQPVLTPFGYHIIRLDSKSDVAYHAHHIQIPIEPVGDHLLAVDARADTLDLLAAEQADPTRLDSVAAQLGLSVASAPPIAEGERVQVDRSPVPDASIWAFEAAPGETSPVIEADHAYYVFRLDSLIPGGVPPLNEIRQQVEERVRREKKRQRTKEIAQQVAAALREGATLRQAAERHGLSVRTLGPFTRTNPSPALRDAPEVIGQAFGLPLGAVGGPLETNLVTFFVQPTALQPADSAAFEAEKEELRGRVIQDARQARLRLVLSSLREEAAIVDNRREIERRAREAAERAPVSPLGF
jgi:peptidyl-prolyl cis-trans isomerase D